MSEKPVCIVEIDDYNGRSTFKLATDELKGILEKAGEHEICLIATAGASRLGKSCFLSYLIRYLQHLEVSPPESNWLLPDSEEKIVAFPYKNTLEAQTKGFWIWPRPFLVQGEGGKTIATFVMDTQGVFANQTMTEWSAIVGLALMTSSVFIFNLQFNPQEEALITLEIFLEYGLMARKQTQKLEDVTDADSLFPFQRLLCLIRDWNSPGTHEYGLIGGKQLIQEWLSPDNPALPRDAKERRVNIKKCFQKIQACLLPHPGSKATSVNFQGYAVDLDDDFYRHMKSTIEGLCRPENLVPKKVAGHSIKQGELFLIFQNFINIVNSPNAPRAIGYMQATYETSCAAAANSALSVYEQNVEQLIKSEKFIPHEKLLERLTQLEKQAANQFIKSRKLGTPDIVKKFQAKLCQDILTINARIQPLDEDQVVNTLIQEAVGKFSIQYQELREQHNLDEDMPVPDEDLEAALKAISNNIFQSFDDNSILEDDKLGKKFSSALNEKLVVLRSNYRKTNDAQFEKMAAILAQITEKLVKKYADEMEESITFLPFIETEKLKELNDQFSKIAITNLTKIPESELPNKLRAHAESNLTQQLKSLLEIKIQENLEAEQDAKDKLEKLVTSLTNEFKTNLKKIIDTSSSIPSEGQLELERMRLKSQADDEFYKHLDTSNDRFCNSYKLKLAQNLEMIYNDVIAEHAEHQNVVKSQVEGWLNNQSCKFRSEMQQQQGNKLSLNSPQYQDLLSKIRTQFLQDTTKYLESIGLQASNSFTTIQKLDEMLHELSENMYQEFESDLKLALNKVRAETDKYVDKYTHQMKTCKTKSRQAYIKEHKTTSKTIHDEFQNLELSQLSGDKVKTILSELSEKIDNAHEILLHQFDTEIKEQSDKIKEAISTSTEIYTSKMINKWKLELAEENELKSHSDKCKNVAILKFKSALGEDCVESLLELEDEIDALFQQGIRTFRETKQSLKDNKIVHTIKAGIDSYTSQMQSLISNVTGDITWFDKHHAEIKMESIEMLLADTNISNLTQNEIQKAQSDFQLQLETIYQELIKQFKQEHANKEEELSVYEISLEQEHAALLQPMADSLLAHDDNILDEQHLQFKSRVIDQVRTKYSMLNSLILSNTVTRISSTLDHSLIKIKESYSQKFEKFDKNLNQLGELIKDALTESDDPDWDDISTTYNRARDDYFKELLMLCNFPSQKLSEDFKKQWLTEANNILSNNRRTFVANEPDPKLFAAVLKNYFEMYEDEMKKKGSNSLVYIDPNKLTEIHNNVTSYLTKMFYKRRPVPLTAFVKDKLRVKFAALLKLRQENNFKIAPTKEAAIGIDLGTTFSCVAIYQADGKVVVLENSSGSPTTPSYVRIEADDDDPVVGEVAKSQASKYPGSTIFDAKRLIGRLFDDPLVQRDIKIWPFTVISDSSCNAAIKVHGVTLKPQTISSKLLSKLIIDAEAKSDRKITSAVITVPAYFKDSQRQATKQAGIDAGLNVLELLNEPTAAAVAYNFEYSMAIEKTILIFDLGGGTFDVALLKIKDANVVVTAIGGDTHLGGEDIDNILVEHCIDMFSLDNPTTNVREGKDSRDNVIRQEYIRRIMRLRNACEKSKIILTNAKTASVNLPVFVSLGNVGLDLNIDITRDQFNTMNHELFKKCIKIVETLLDDANVIVEDIDEVVLVGGSTRIPKIQEMLTKFFGGKTLNCRLHPDEAVAKGAAIRAAVLHGYESVKSTIQDVIPMSIGIKVLGGGFSQIFPRNSKYPDKRSKRFHSSDSAETDVEIAIYEGEEETVSKNNLLGRFNLSGIPAGSDSQVIEVMMEIDANGILITSARCEANGVTKALRLNGYKAGGSRDVVERLPPGQR